MSKESHPLVSIVIPVYNGANYLREAVDSALAQTYDNIEIIVVNDGSTDTTEEIAKSYGDKIRYFHKENGGVVSALNFGIEKMQGEYFSWLSHDDLYMPEKIEKQVSALQKHKGSRPAFCVCNCTFIDDMGIETNIKSLVKQESASDNPKCGLFLESIGFNGIMVLIPKVLFDICGRFKPSLATHEYDMWLRIMDKADIVVEPEYLTLMRIHPNQVSSQRKQDAHLEIDNFLGANIRDIPHSEFEAFVTKQVNKKGISYIIDLFNSYMWFQHFPFTAIQTLKQFRLMFQKPSTCIDSLLSSLLGHPNIEGIKECFANRFHSDKPLIVIHCENFTDDIFKGISTGIGLLSMQYEIVLFYQTIEENYLQPLCDINIIPIKLMYHLDFNMPLCIGLLSYLLNAKLFWYYSSDNSIQYIKIFHFLSIMEIFSIASFYDIDKAYINMQEIFNPNYIDYKKHLSKTSLITSSIAPSTPGLLSFDNIITIPNNSMKALVRWKKIFDVLLSTNHSFELTNRINDSLSTLLEKVNIPFCGYINNYIRDFLVEVDKKSTALIYSYEQRKFWKLTKPLRICVWFFRKAIKAFYLIINRKKSIGDIVYQIRMLIKNRRIPI